MPEPISPWDARIKTILDQHFAGSVIQRALLHRSIRVAMEQAYSQGVAWAEANPRQPESMGR